MQRVAKSADGIRSVWLGSIELTYVDLGITEWDITNGRMCELRGRARLRMLVDELQAHVGDGDDVIIWVSDLERHSIATPCERRSNGTIRLKPQEAQALLARLTH